MAEVTLFDCNFKASTVNVAAGSAMETAFPGVGEQFRSQSGWTPEYYVTANVGLKRTKNATGQVNRLFAIPLTTVGNVKANFRFRFLGAAANGNGSGFNTPNFIGAVVSAAANGGHAQVGIGDFYNTNISDRERFTAQNWGGSNIQYITSENDSWEFALNTSYEAEIAYTGAGSSSSAVIKIWAVSAPGTVLVNRTITLAGASSYPALGNAGLILNAVSQSELDNLVIETAKAVYNDATAAPLSLVSPCGKLGLSADKTTAEATGPVITGGQATITYEWRLHTAYDDLPGTVIQSGTFAPPATGNASVPALNWVVTTPNLNQRRYVSCRVTDGSTTFAHVGGLTTFTDGRTLLNLFTPPPAVPTDTERQAKAQAIDWAGLVAGKTGVAFILAGDSITESAQNQYRDILLADLAAAGISGVTIRFRNHGHPGSGWQNWQKNSPLNADANYGWIYGQAASTTKNNYQLLADKINQDVADGYVVFLSLMHGTNIGTSLANDIASNQQFRDDLFAECPNLSLYIAHRSPTYAYSGSASVNQYIVDEFAEYQADVAAAPTGKIKVGTLLLDKYFAGQQRDLYDATFHPVGSGIADNMKFRFFSDLSVLATAFPAPVSIAGVTVTGASGGANFAVSWPAVSGATGYTVSLDGVQLATGLSGTSYNLAKSALAFPAANTVSVVAQTAGGNVPVGSKSLSGSTGVSAGTSNRVSGQARRY